MLAAFNGANFRTRLDVFEIARQKPGMRCDFLLLCVALHDLGQINCSLRDMLEQGCAQPFGRHWEVTQALLEADDDLFALTTAATAAPDADLCRYRGASWQAVAF